MIGTSKSWTAGLAGVALVSSLGLASAAQAAAGFVALEGSDATALHMDGSYTPQLFKYLQGGSAKSVLVYNPTGVIDLSGFDGGVATTNVTSLAGLTFTDYSALYVESPNGCCTADNTVLDGFGGAIAAFIAGGGNLSIENYGGGTYDGTVPGGANPVGSVSGTGCTDLETVTVAGIAKGFSQPPVDGCWEHQAYSNAYWGPLGYIDLIHADPALVADGSGNGSGLLAFGGTLGATTPEPATWAMMLVGFAAVGFAMRSGRKTATTAA